MAMYIHCERNSENKELLRLEPLS